MTSSLARWLRAPQLMRPLDLARGAAGAAVGVGLVGLIGRLLAGGALSIPLLIPPIGASAVLVFAAPASPLAQPRCVIGGNLVSACVGVACAQYIASPLLAPAVAVGVAIALMALIGCLHPPGGAVALGSALAGGPVLAVLGPVVLCSVLLVLAGLMIVNLTGRTYPHRAALPLQAHGTSDAPPVQRVGFTPADLDQALARYGELLDVNRDDLDALFREVELQAHRRLHAEIKCGAVMSRDVIAVEAQQSAAGALAVLQAHDLRAAPVIDAERRVVGMARRAELLAGGDEPVESVLDPQFHKVAPDAPIEALLPLLSSGAAHEAMVVDDRRVLLGVITQTDLLAVLYRAHIVEALAARPA